MDFSNKTQITARKYNVDPRTVLFAYLVAGGVDKVDAYFCLFVRGAKKPTREQINTDIADLIQNNPGLKILIQKIKLNKQVNKANDNEVKTAIQEQNNKDNIINSEELNKYTDKTFIIAKLAQAAKNSTGKELAQILMNIADLQRMKQEETKSDDERRRFYLPYVSHCRTCKILQLFKEFNDVST